MGGGPQVNRGRRSAVNRVKVPRWVACAFFAISCLLVALGIYIGLHVRVFGPDW